MPVVTVIYDCQKHKRLSQNNLTTISSNPQLLVVRAGTYDFRSRGISDQDALQSVLSNLAEWMKTLIDQNPANAPMDVSRASAEVQSDDAILQDPRAVPLLGVLRSEARRIIGEVRYSAPVASVSSLCTLVACMDIPLVYLNVSQCTLNRARVAQCYERWKLYRRRMRRVRAVRRTSTQQTCFTFSPQPSCPPSGSSCPAA